MQIFTGFFYVNLDKKLNSVLKKSAEKSATLKFHSKFVADLDFPIEVKGEICNKTTTQVDMLRLKKKSPLCDNYTEVAVTY